ncbi:MAG: dehydrogenase, partial [Akkermansiaceae bacterium]|nr:dehydrogenase [Akkermansiaceae bacterium]
MLEPEGSGFKERDGRNLLASADGWCAPVFSQVGPDGQVWVADWYDFIIQHNPLPKGFKMGKGNAYITPLREHKMARIYRVTYGDPSGNENPRLDVEDAKSLLGALGHSNLFWRLTAQRLLVDRGKKDVVDELKEAVLREKKLDAIGSSPMALHSLWTLHGLGAATGDILIQALRHPAASVRRAAVTMMPRDERHRDILIGWKLLVDVSPSVQLAALLALVEMPPAPEVGPALASALEELEGSRDHWLPSAF